MRAREGEEAVTENVGGATRHELADHARRHYEELSKAGLDWLSTRERPEINRPLVVSASVARC